MERSRKLCAVAAFAVAAVGVSAGSAFAGEITGNGKPTGIRGRAQSFPAPSRDRTMASRPPDEPLRTCRAGDRSPRRRGTSSQRSGSIPGDACNGRTGFLSGGE